MTNRVCFPRKKSLEIQQFLLLLNSLVHTHIHAYWQKLLKNGAQERITHSHTHDAAGASGWPSSSVSLKTLPFIPPTRRRYRAAWKTQGWRRKIRTSGTTCCNMQYGTPINYGQLPFDEQKLSYKNGTRMFHSHADDLCVCVCWGEGAEL